MSTQKTQIKAKAQWPYSVLSLYRSPKKSQNYFLKAIILKCLQPKILQQNHYKEMVYWYLWYCILQKPFLKKLNCNLSTWREKQSKINLYHCKLNLKGKIYQVENKHTNLLNQRQTVLTTVEQTNNTRGQQYSDQAILFKDKLQTS